MDPYKKSISISLQMFYLYHSIIQTFFLFFNKKNFTNLCKSLEKLFRNKFCVTENVPQNIFTWVKKRRSILEGAHFNLTADSSSSCNWSKGDLGSGHRGSSLRNHVNPQPPACILMWSPLATIK